MSVNPVNNTCAEFHTLVMSTVELWKTIGGASWRSPIQLPLQDDLHLTDMQPSEEPRTSFPTSSFRILLVDDFEPWRKQVRAMLQSHPDLKVVGEAKDGLEAIQKAGELKPDLILLDIGMPALSGIEAAEGISKLDPAAKILFVTQENDPDVVATALSNGAKGLVLKVNAHRELLPAVEAVLEGRRF